MCGFRADFMRNVRELDEDLADREFDPETRLNYKAGSRIRRFCLCGFRVNFMRNTREIGKDSARESHPEPDLLLPRQILR